MKEKFYTSIVSFFCLVVVVTSLLSAKLFPAPFSSNFYLPVGMLCYPFTFLAGNIVTEIYGSRHASFMIYLGFGLALITHFFIDFAISLPSSNPEIQVAFKAAFGLNGITIYGSMLAFIISQTLEIKLFLFIKKLTNGKYLWLRNNGAIVVSQFIDTFIANWILLYLGMKLDLEQTIHIILACYVYKLILSFCGTPLFYGFVYLLKNNIGQPDSKPIVVDA
ncbi:MULTISPECIES: queuosine precursor transporter [Parachlamydia]|jgi:uncharacterized integral membrane protein (TIGR00697 family)|uniref:Probable queuosine precursor transporter n=1 Tax=Parachlamydia acanthamoebae (strain UV7) TaxID=765952 RepID=F8L0D1_PARAV|nr:queuosine precursor transporter [Parachlamydia acanthamoebae]EFB41631.1 hypothetical protein pah_c026o066 [Parachlamydia acanthamoebae str. Hall's coccus]CCB86661.1 uncharacterized protein ypdP [Parachlamydia acanthamoebae UV-7]